MKFTHKKNQEIQTHQDNLEHRNENHMLRIRKPRDANNFIFLSDIGADRVASYAKPIF